MKDGLIDARFRPAPSTFRSVSAVSVEFMFASSGALSGLRSHVSFDRRNSPRRQRYLSTDARSIGAPEAMRRGIDVPLARDFSCKGGILPGLDDRATPHAAAMAERLQHFVARDLQLQTSPDQPRAPLLKEAEVHATHAHRRRSLRRARCTSAGRRRAPGAEGW